MLIINSNYTKLILIFNLIDKKHFATFFKCLCSFFFFPSFFALFLGLSFLSFSLSLSFFFSFYHTHTFCLLLFLFPVFLFYSTFLDTKPKVLSGQLSGSMLKMVTDSFLEVIKKMKTFLFIRHVLLILSFRFSF